MAEGDGDDDERDPDDLAGGSLSGQANLLKNIRLGSNITNVVAGQSDLLKGMRLESVLTTQSALLKNIGPGSNMTNVVAGQPDLLKSMRLESVLSTQSALLKNIGLGSNMTSVVAGQADLLKSMERGSGLTSVVSMQSDLLKNIGLASSITSVVAGQVDLLNTVGARMAGWGRLPDPSWRTTIGISDLAGSRDIHLVSAREYPVSSPDRQSRRDASVFAALSSIAREVNAAASIVDDGSESFSNSPSNALEDRALGADSNDELAERVTAVETMIEPVFAFYAQRQLKIRENPLLRWVTSPPSVYDVLGWLALLSAAGFSPVVIVVTVSLLVKLISSLSER